MLEKVKYYFNNLDWSSKRRFIYILIISMALLAYIFYKLYPTLFPAPTCYDKKINGLELGIDCGGACNLQCKNTYLPLDTILEKSFVGDGNSSDILVLLENKNRYSAPGYVSLDIDLYNEDGELVEVKKINQLAGTQKYIPIFIDNYVNIKDESKLIKKVFAKNINYDMYSSLGAYDVSVVDYVFKSGEDDRSDNAKLNIKVKNIYKNDINEKLRLYVLLRDELDNIVGVNYQDLDTFIFEEIKSLNFLWPYKIAISIKNIDTLLVSNLYK